MPTIVDSLVVTLGLDDSKYKKKSAETTKDFKTLRKEANETASAVYNIAGAVGAMFAAFTAGRGIKDFIDDITDSNAELERMSKNLNTSVEDINAFGNASARNGGSSQAFQGTLSNLSKEMTQLAVTGESSLLPYMRALNVQMGDAEGRARPMTDILSDVAGALQKLPREKAFNLGQMMNIDQGTLNAMLEGQKSFDKLIADQKQMAGLTKQQTINSLKLSQAIFDLKIQSQSFGRELIGDLSPAMTNFIEAVRKGLAWLDKHRGLLAGIGSVIAVTLVPTLWAAATAAWAFLAPLLLFAAPIIAAATAVGLLADDWFTWVEGGKSALGELLGTFENVTKKFFIFRDAMRKVWGGTTADKDAAVQAFKNIFNKEVQAPAPATTGAAGGTRGLRNNNPGNLEYNSFTRRLGATGSDGRFAIFPTPAAGIAAMQTNLSGYGRKGINTVSGIINRWAPSSENNTGAYIASVAKRLGVGANTPLNMNDPAVLAELSRAITQHENGKQPYGADVFAAANQARMMQIAGSSSARVGGGNTSSSETNIGTMIVNTQATDAAGIARDLSQELQNRSLAYQADTGVN